MRRAVTEKVFRESPKRIQSMILNRNQEGVGRIEELDENSYVEISPEGYRTQVEIVENIPGKIVMKTRNSKLRSTRTIRLEALTGDETKVVVEEEMEGTSLFYEWISKLFLNLTKMHHRFFYTLEKRLEERE